MPVNIEEWLNLVIEKLLFVGLQGNYNRDEANAESDIDLELFRVTF